MSIRLLRSCRVSRKLSGGLMPLAFAVQVRGVSEPFPQRWLCCERFVQAPRERPAATRDRLQRPSAFHCPAHSRQPVDAAVNTRMN